MADTVITPAREYDSGSGAAGWAIAVILLLGIVLFGILVWPGVGRNVVPATPTNTNPGIDLNVTLPEGALPGTTNTGGQGTQSGGTNNTGTQQPAGQ